MIFFLKKEYLKCKHGYIIILGLTFSAYNLYAYKNTPKCFFMYANFPGQLIFSLFLILVYLHVSLCCCLNKPHTVA